MISSLLMALCNWLSTCPLNYINLSLLVVSGTMIRLRDLYSLICYIVHSMLSRSYRIISLNLQLPLLGRVNTFLSRHAEMWRGCLPKRL